MTSQNSNWDELYSFAKKQQESRISYTEIEKQLVEKTGDTVQALEIINQLKKDKHNIRHKYGLRKLTVGSLLLIAGFLITCINFHSNTSFTTVMYSFTIAGLLFVFWGLYDVVG